MASSGFWWLVSSKMPAIDKATRSTGLFSIGKKQNLCDIAHKHSARPV